MDQNVKQNMEILQKELEEKRDKNLNMLVGIDGFVDEIVHVVDKRQDFDTYERLCTIEAFGTRIVRASGLSTNVEFVTQNTKLGGNGPIFSNALLEYGANLTYVGALGVPDIHPVFKSMAEKCTAVYSLSNPGHTDAVEFEDGKLMMGKLTALNDITWARCKEIMGGVEKIAEIICNCQLFGMENWTMVPRMSEVWEGILAEVFPLLPDVSDKPIAFFDLADPEKRTKEDTLHAMKLIGQFNKKFKATLGLNEKELYEIAEVFGIVAKRGLLRIEELKEVTRAVYTALGIHCLVVHPTKEALACVDGEVWHSFGPYCAKPVLTTGAGDNFNAGFCLGQALGLSPLSSLLLGEATSGFYVRNAKSPTTDELVQFLKDWAAGMWESK